MNEFTNRVQIKFVFILSLLLCCISANSMKPKPVYSDSLIRVTPIKLAKRGVDSNYVFLGIKDSTLTLDPVKSLHAIIRTDNNYSSVPHSIEIGGSLIKEIQMNNFEMPRFILTLSRLKSINFFHVRGYNFDLMKDTVESHDMHEMIIRDYNLSESSFKTFTASYNQIAKLRVDYSHFLNELEFDHSLFRKVSIANSIVGKIQFSEITVTDAMSMSDCSIQKDSYISGNLGASLSLVNLTFDNNVTLDLRNCRKIKGKVNLYVLNVPIENLQIDWRNFKLDSTTRADYTSCKVIYKRLLENFSKHYQIESYELVDKEYQNYRYLHFSFLKLGWVFDKFIWLWWDYGYGGWQVILWMVLLPLLWALITYRSYDSLHKHVYKIDNFTPFTISPHPHNPQRTFGNALIYVSVIFFTVGVKLDKLKYERRPLLLLFLAIYLNGLCCIYFLINYLLKS
ncbi:hypothetical protein KXD93_16705 [Mucilaginibacter sp. BJC16-A38]|uniref:hypothetical protein n=1 Tax=Mucilaginibacter phenanthrenivorans TaxID=1234842 RepID=UPI0021570043|nr:hypothetical protein [Mucilaginibacter phenanthrenivorans]MCR8559300.1 hypothetical protein [Mucilaginibacter phenanthrenivorans]